MFSEFMDGQPSIGCRFDALRDTQLALLCLICWFSDVSINHRRSTYCQNKSLPSNVRFLYPGGGGTTLDGFNGDVQPNRVWFSEGFVLNGVSISSIFVLYRVSLIYRTLTKSHIFISLPIYSILK